MPNNCEREIFSFINLIRVAPIHSANTIFECVRNRYSLKDRTYQNIVNLNRGNNKGPSYTKTVEGISAVDDLIQTLINN